MSDAAQDPQQLAQGNSGRDENTGRPWLAEIPSHWKSVPVTRVSRAISGGTPTKDVSEYWDGQIPWVTPKDMKQREIKKSQDSITELALRESGLKLVDPEAVLIVVRGMILAHSFPVALTRAPVTINQDMKALVFADAVDPDFATWALEGMAGVILAETVDQAAHGTRAIRMERWRRVSVPVPPVQEQRAIAFFLERETEKIDILMEKKRRLLQLLAERRTALITQAVTRGLDPDVPMKESGVEWLGEIPEHWEVARVKHVARLASGHTPSRSEPDYWVNCTIPWITLSDVGRLRSESIEYLTDTKERISEVGLRNSAAELLPEDTVVLSRTASVGFSAIMGHPMATTQDFANWVCGSLLRPAFLLYVFRGMKHEFRRIMMGSTHQTIYMPAIRRLMTPLPPLEEQDRIVEHIRRSTSKTDETLEAATRAIALLEEYRTALISAAVTGKIDMGDKVPA